MRKRGGAGSTGRGEGIRRSEAIGATGELELTKGERGEYT